MIEELEADAEVAEEEGSFELALVGYMKTIAERVSRIENLVISLGLSLGQFSVNDVQTEEEEDSV